jgi:predicted membrane protein
MTNEQRPQYRFYSTKLVVGIIIIALGLLFLAGNLGLISARYVLRHFWPVLFILVGVLMLSQRESRRGKQWGWVWLLIGIWMLSERLDWIDVNIWQLFFPTLLLVVGGMLVWRALSTQKEEPIVGTEPSEYVRSFAVMSGNELRPVSRPFRGADLSAVMGGLKLDLTGAKMEGDAAAVEVFAFWGGIEIYVPPEWTVTSKVTTFMGGFVDKRRPSSVVPTKTLIVRGFAFMGGIEVKN